MLLTAIDSGGNYIQPLAIYSSYLQ